MSTLASRVISATDVMVSNFSGSQIRSCTLQRISSSPFSRAADLIDCSATIVMHVAMKCLLLLT